MFCPSCGAQCPPASIACHACGAILPGLLQAPPASAPVAPQAVRVEPAHAPLPPSHLAPGSPAGLGLPNGAAHAHSSPSHGGVMPGNATMMQEPQSYYQPARRTAPVDERLLGRAKLVVEQGKILGEQFLLSDPEIMIGRYDQGSGTCPDIDLTAQDPAYVHRQHVRLVFNQSGTELQAWDLGGRNGSYVNNQKIEPHTATRVRVGDKLRVGRVVMRMQLASDNELKGPMR